MTDSIVKLRPSLFFAFWSAFLLSSIMHCFPVQFKFTLMVIILNFLLWLKTDRKKPVLGSVLRLRCEKETVYGNICSFFFV